MKCPDRENMGEYVTSEGLYAELPEDMAEEIIIAVAKNNNIPAMTPDVFNQFTQHIKSCAMCMARYRGAKVEFNNMLSKISIPI